MKEKAKILVVDDDSGIAEMLKTLLEFYEFQVTVTDNPDTAEELIQRDQIDLVMLDMLISGVNGTDVCQRLRKDDKVCHIPVLMMSALHNAGPKCKAAGANDFIAKPFEMEELIAKINEVIKPEKDASC